MPSVKIYGAYVSAPTRILLMTCEVLGIQYELILTSNAKGETRTPEFLKLNPQHTIPVLVDGDFVVTESRAAAAYLVNAYGWEGCNLYPSDPKTRAVIDQRLYFDIGTFYNALMDCYMPIVYEGQSKPSKKAIDRVFEVLAWVQDFVAPTGYVAGTEHLTLADISCIATFHSLVACDFVDLTKFKPDIRDWCDRCKNDIPNYKSINQEGSIEFGNAIKAIAAANE